MADDIEKHPLFNILGKIITLVFCFLLCCLLLTCCRYKRLEHQYEIIQQRNDKVEIVKQGSAAAEDEKKTRPTKRNKAEKPDVNTFGIRTDSDRQSDATNADNEVELGEIGDVDFA